MKKALSVLLCLVLLAGIFAAGGGGFVQILESITVRANAESGTYGVLSYEIYNGEVTITGCDKNASGELVIPDKIEGYPVTSIGGYAFSDCTNLTSVTIPDSVTKIGYYTFFGCTGLASVTIGNSVTSIDGSAFEDCTGLTEITIPDSVISIGILAFRNCTGLTSITIGNSVTYIGEAAFEGCKGLTRVTIPDSVTSIGHEAFRYCTGLTSIIIPGSVTSLGGFVFSGCSGLSSITVDSGNTVYHSKGNCLIETDRKTLIAGCNNSIIPDDGSVTCIDWVAFFECTEFTSVTIPDSVTRIGDAAFGNCSKLTSITIPDSVTSIGAEAFYNSGYYKREENWTDNVLYIGNHLIQAKPEITGDYSIKVNTKTVADSAFMGCIGLTSVTIPNSVTNISTGSFYGCARLRSITIPDNVISIGRFAFDGCTGLTSVTIPDSVTSIGYSAFYGCAGLTDVYFTGSEEEWNAIEIGEANDCLINATIHYNSSVSTPTEPTPTEPTPTEPTPTEPETPTEDDELADAKAAAKDEIDKAVPADASDAVKALAGIAKQMIDMATDVDGVTNAKTGSIIAINAQIKKEQDDKAAKELADAKTSAKSEIDKAVPADASEAVKKAAADAKAKIDKASTVDEIETDKDTAIDEIGKLYAKQKKEAEEKEKAEAEKKITVNSASGTITNVKYNQPSKIIASATGLPKNYKLAIYEGGSQMRAVTANDKGDAAVEFETGAITSDRTFTVKVLDASGKEVDGKSKTITIDVNDGFFQKIISFFLKIFGALKLVEIK